MQIENGIISILGVKYSTPFQTYVKPNLSWENENVVFATPIFHLFNLFNLF